MNQEIIVYPGGGLYLFAESLRAELDWPLPDMEWYDEVELGDAAWQLGVECANLQFGFSTYERSRLAGGGWTAPWDKAKKTPAQWEKEVSDLSDTDLRRLIAKATFSELAEHWPGE